MGKRAKVILNEYSAKNLLMRDTLDLDKFYTADLKLFVEVARKEIEILNNKEEQLIRRLEDLIVVGEQVENEWAVDICKMVIKELKGSDSNVKD